MDEKVNHENALLNQELGFLSLQGLTGLINKLISNLHNFDTWED